MMSEAALEEVSVLSSIYCREGEFRLLQSAQDGLTVQINSTVGGGERGLDVRLLFHLHPRYPSCPPAISVSSTSLSRTQCHDIRQKLQDQAAALPPEPMVHQLVEWLQQCVEVTESCRGGEDEEGKDRETEEEWTAVLSLDHIRSRSRYVGLLERWTQQLQLTGRLLLGRTILVILQGARPNIKEFCRLLKTVKVDVDSSGKKCKERMMKVLIESPSSSSCGHGLQGFGVKNYESLPELTAAFQEINMTELYQQILPSLRD
ncbi:RWD domain-containing protein 3 isoform X1 [Sebastes umbrosus]|uniref:RWD domain-containing protein 3 isoform X1 n=1 Tax=Sebastes umbrosus TaxID=72105 RepID=UPI00189F6726|nr:RWD domain-containing protein 3 isoform X1 [Sebastes umbrosus]XP_037610118.1 RWD domain-containing protein 3 isoform X1 [Sebastes umbrosus]XP_037610127.1 RWD domain-containing protein 3 isoform X1 [Sebastes umbrosus]XP_037610136.1 RWD domain-containing protein 3 isoform X1 [Sebastes umbrosus]XP_037610144.1 RWD domain-containing protein 3 isoform X1 [Sebastes umbrosus]XP_037610152.1 RWD domain-containing protein 3 isoform X1 [Sebastes umbrosus]